MRSQGKRRTFIQALSENITGGKLTFIPCDIERKNNIVKSLNELGIETKVKETYKKNEETGINEMTGYFFGKEEFMVNWNK